MSVQMMIKLPILNGTKKPPAILDGKKKCMKFEDGLSFIRKR